MLLPRHHPDVLAGLFQSDRFRLRQRVVMKRMGGGAPDTPEEKPEDVDEADALALDCLLRGENPPATPSALFLLFFPIPMPG